MLEICNKPDKNNFVEQGNLLSCSEMKQNQIINRRQTALINQNKNKKNNK